MRADRSLYLIILAGITLFVIAHGRAVDHRLRELDQTIAGPATAAAFERGDLVPRFLSPWALDSFLWVDHARQLARSNAWRLRTTHFDNAPEGRPVRWHSGLALWLGGLGQVWASVLDTTVEEGIERAAVWACPILFLGYVVLFSGIVLRFWGALAASTVVVAMLASGDVYGGFLPGEPDHHGLTAVCALGTMLGLLLAHAHLRAARFGMIFSALWGAVGLCVSAISQSFAFLCIGLGIVCALGWRSRRPTEERQSRSEAEVATLDPGLWRLWGIVGGMASLALYVFEYVPDAISWHLEVNHPLYALAWIAGAEMLAILASISKRAPGFGSTFRPFPRPSLHQASNGQRLKLSTCLLFVCAPAILVMTLGEEAHVMRNPFVAALHGMISEFQPFTDALRVGDLSFVQALGILPIIAVVGVVLVLRPGSSARDRRLLVLCLVPLAAATVLRAYQVRWGAIWGGLAVPMAAVVVPILWRELRRRWGHPAASLVLGLGLILAIAASPYPELRGDVLRARMGEELTVAELRALILRDIALQIGNAGSAVGSSGPLGAGARKDKTSNVGSSPNTDTPSEAQSGVSVLAGPESTVMLSYFGGFAGVGTLYWENAAGLRAAADIATAPTDEEALRLLERRGITHIVVTEWEDYAIGYDAVLRPDATDRDPNTPFLHRIIDPARRPAWLHELPYPELPQAESLELRTTTFTIGP